MVTVVVATRNAHKLQEIRSMVHRAGVPIELEDLSAFPDMPEVVESGITFEANATLKAQAVANHTGLAALADDSGLCVDALGGAPGIFSARWAGKQGDDAANTALLMAQLSDVPDAHRGAHYACALTLALPAAVFDLDSSNAVVTTYGTFAGRIAREPRGTNGFGYDPMVISEAYPDRTVAELPTQLKDAVSHRSVAIQAMLPYLQQLVTKHVSEERKKGFL